MYKSVFERVRTQWQLLATSQILLERTQTIKKMIAKMNKITCLNVTYAWIMQRTRLSVFVAIYFG